MIRSRADFQTFFENVLKPAHEENYEKGYRLRKIRKRLGFSIPIVIVLLYFIYNSFLSSFNIPFVALGIGLVILSIIALIFLVKKFPELLPFILNNGSDNSKVVIMNDILASVLPGFTFEPEKAITADEFGSYGLISRHSFNRFHSSDTIVGTYKGNPIRISECTAIEIEEREEKRPPRQETIFKGIVLELYPDISTDFTLSAINKKTKKHNFLDHIFDDYPDLEEISLSNPYFDKNYNIQTNQNILSRKLLQPKELHSLSIQQEKLNGILNFSYSNGRIVLLIDRTDDLFEIFDSGKYTADIIWDELLTLISYIKVYDVLNENTSSLT